MNQKCRYVAYSFLLLSIIILTDCKPRAKKEFQIDPAFTTYITAFTAGLIPGDADIRIQLANDIEGDYQLNEPLDMKLFRFNPAIEGYAIMTDRRTIVFKPSERLKPGTEYTAVFNLDKIVTVVPAECKQFRFLFRTIKQSFIIEVSGFSAYVNNDLRWNRGGGRLQTADFIEDEQIEKVLSASQEGRHLEISWDHSPDGKLHTFLIDSILRKEEESSFIVSWTGSKIGVDNNDSKEITIPSLADFIITDISVIQQPEQYVLIRFSDPLMVNQFLRGLIYLENSTDLQFIPENNEVKAYPSVRQTGQLEITIEPGIRNISGFHLKEKSQYKLNFEEVKPSVRLTGRGVILPNSEGLIFPFEAVNLKAVDIRIIRIYENNIAQFLQVNYLDGDSQIKRVGRLALKKTVELTSERPIDYGNWNTFFIDLGDLIKTEPGAIYRVEIGFRKSQSIYFCDGQDSETGFQEPEEITGEDEIPYEEELSYWDSYESYYDEGYYYWDYDWNEREDPCSDVYYGTHRSVARNILASDLGIIAKQGNDNSMVLCITDLRSTLPISGVEVDIYNYQQQLLAEVQTDNNGLARVQLKSIPFLLIARYNEQRGYLRLDDGSSLSLSRFDVSGNKVNKGLKGFLYGERGVWRPGDSLYLTFMLEDKQGTLPENHPVRFELFNPQQQLVYKSIQTSGSHGFYSFATATPPDAPTGNWTANVTIGGTVFSNRIRIETIKPNRLNINLDFGTDRLSVSQEEIRASLAATWLHGAVADNLRASVSVTYLSQPTVFKNYPDYVFDDPVRIFYSGEYLIFDDRLNEEGKALFYPDLAPDIESPGMLSARFITRVFEESGEFSIDQFSLPYSPYKGYIGMKTPAGDISRGMLLTDTTHVVDIVTVDSEGNPVNRQDVEVDVYKIEWKWWWDATYEDLASYLGASEHLPVVSQTINTRNGRGKFEFRINYPEWGRFLIRAIDPVSGHASGKIVYIDWPGWAGRGQREQPEGAAMLSFSTDKQEYMVGEKAILSFPSTSQGRALLSFENGSRVIDMDWIETSDGETMHSFMITEEMSPNIYIHLSLIQPHAQSVNDLPIRLYGIVPIAVEDPETRLHPVLKMPDEIRPNSSVTITVSEENEQECSYTIALVDEGLLGLTRFKTPDAWSSFYAREALGVRTWDLYDMVIGAFGSRIESLLSIGGGYEGEISEEARKKEGRFPPMVIYKGPFTLDKGQTRTHLFNIPNYIGSIRTMVVAGNQKAYGATEKTIPVRQPLMVLATLPRVLGPSEQVDLPVTVFATDEKIRQVSIKVETNNLLNPVGEQQKQITFSKTGEMVEHFLLQVPSRTGIGKVKVIAVCQKEKSENNIELDIRNPNPPVTVFEEATIEKGGKWNCEYSLPGVPGTNKIALEVANIPPLDIERRLQFLMTYPHGCIEQTVSAVFSQLYLDDITEFDQETLRKLQANINAGIVRLQQFILSDGSFTYWPGANVSDAWGTNYAGHFLVEAENQGFNLRSDIKKNWVKYQKKAARSWTNSTVPYNQEDLIQAYRLYTLSLANEPELGSMNRLREIPNLSVQARWRLAAAYAIIGQPDVARDLINNLSSVIENYPSFNDTYGSRERDWAMILETLTLMNNRTEGARYAKMISGILSSNQWLSTQTTGYCLLAMSKFAGSETISGDLGFEYSYNKGKTVKVSTRLPVARTELTEVSLQGNLEILNTSTGLLFARLVMTGIPEKGYETEASNHLTMNIRYSDLNDNTIDVSRIKQGTDLLVHVDIAIIGNLGNYTDMAMTQIFPSGWEIRNTRLEETEGIFNADKPDYQDIRDDRIQTYFDLEAFRKKTFIVQVNAAYKGRYYLPAIVCEAMYDNTVNANSRGMWVEIY
jgi:uncharacterized protein YfaS (alpha-2-macroglobulin family)